MSGNCDKKKNQTDTILGLRVLSDLSWHSHMEFIVRSTSRKLGCVSYARLHFASEQPLTLYKSQLCPTLEVVLKKITLKLISAAQKRAVQPSK